MSTSRTERCGKAAKQDIYWERLNIKSRSVTLEAARRQNRTNLEYSSFLGMKKIVLHRNGEEKILFQTDTTAFIIKFFVGYAVVLGGFGVICGVDQTDISGTGIG